MSERAHERLAADARDAEVAEKVMGWKHAGDPVAIGDALVGRGETVWLYIPDGGIGVARRDRPTEWSPTTDIAAAWEVVERIREILGARDNAKAGEPDLWAILEQADGEWVAEINWLHHDGTVNEHYSKAATAPLAICLTALQVVEQFTEAAALAALQAVEKP